MWTNCKVEILMSGVSSPFQNHQSNFMAKHSERGSKSSPYTPRSSSMIFSLICRLWGSRMFLSTPSPLPLPTHEGLFLRGRTPPRFLSQMGFPLSSCLSLSCLVFPHASPTWKVETTPNPKTRKLLPVVRPLYPLYHSTNHFYLINYFGVPQVR